MMRTELMEKCGRNKWRTMQRACERSKKAIGRSKVIIACKTVECQMEEIDGRSNYPSAPTRDFKSRKRE